ncbi:hypothetical protein AGMMS50256_25220 [Betaproteobacteria bacterium]|nr:hypothetical protein AGMMS50256_25220 [Betaproteobacteria bacterium]
MNTQVVVLTRAQAELELDLLELEAEEVEDGMLFAKLRSLEIPREVAIRLEALAGVTRKVGGKLVAIGKIIILKLIEFVEKHPNMAVGIALGAALSTLITAIPVLGPLLAPVALALGVAVGGIAGHGVDKGVTSPVEVIAITQDVIEIARVFFAWLIALFRAVADELMEGSAA